MNRAPNWTARHTHARLAGASRAAAARAHTHRVWRCGVPGCLSLAAHTHTRTARTLPGRMHPSTPRQRRVHAPQPLSAASLLNRAAAASRAMTPSHKGAVVAILSLFLLWNALTPGGDGGGGGGPARTSAAAKSGQLEELPECELTRECMRGGACVCVCVLEREVTLCAALPTASPDSMSCQRHVWGAAYCRKQGAGAVFQGGGGGGGGEAHPSSHQHKPSLPLPLHPSIHPQSSTRASPGWTRTAPPSKPTAAASCATRPTARCTGTARTRAVGRRTWWVGPATASAWATAAGPRAWT